MADLFPRQTVQIRFEEPTAIRRLTFSLVEMAVITGVVLRIFRSFALTNGSTSGMYLVGVFALGAVILLFMLSAHLANYTLRRWLYRAPLFGLVEVAAEALIALLLIWLGREPIGSMRAEFGDWPSIVMGTLWTRLALIALWTPILAASVTIVRKMVRTDPEADEDETPPPSEPREPGRSSSGSQLMR